MRRAVRARANAASDAALGGRHHSVVHLVVRVNLPVERLSVETLEGWGVRADDLEPCDWVWHDISLFSGGSFRGRHGIAQERVTQHPRVGGRVVALHVSRPAVAGVA